MSFLPRFPAMGQIALVGAGPGAADLLTIRALRRIEAADVIFHDRLIDPEVLALSPARKVFVGKEVGANAWPQTRINAVITAAALSGLKVVRLKSGDPSIFGRAAEELDAARAAGIPIEIVPGITAASAAASALGRPLTERGQTERLVIATATCRPGTVATLAIAPGTTLALYMAMHRLAEVEAELMAMGVPPESDVQIVQSAGCENQRIVECTLHGMANAAAGFANPAIVLVRWTAPAMVGEWTMQRSSITC
ncbi:uroporphyrinogen-III C-methyltransferase [Cereibacter sp. SYSU M97828]|nr:uroporphyrinogen-III C-methyltransferase [Cereibacter flavus]